MDSLTRNFYELTFRNEFRERRGEAFQDLFSSILEKRYPAGDFQRVRPWGSDGDRKNDGYIRSRRILFQCYAPDAATVSEILAKIEEDFHGALPHWKDHFDTWVFVHNDIKGIAPRVSQRLLELSAANPSFRLETWTFDDVLKILRDLNERDLADLFGPVPSRRDVLMLGVSDLMPVLDQLTRLPPAPEPDLRPVPADKLARNLLSDAVRQLLQLGMSRADLVRMYFRDRPLDQDRIAGGFQQKYSSLRAEGAAPDDVFGALQRYAGGAGATPSQQVAVLAVLAFFFESCDIFERPDPIPETP